MCRSVQLRHRNLLTFRHTERLVKLPFVRRLDIDVRMLLHSDALSESTAQAKQAYTDAFANASVSFHRYVDTLRKSMSASE